MNNRPFLNELHCLSGAKADGCFGLSSGAGWSAHEAWLDLPVSSARSLRIMERIVSRGGVLLAGGRRCAAGAAVAACIGIATVGDAHGGETLNVGAGSTAVGETLGAVLTYSRMNISNGGVASDTTISSGGRQDISNGGVAAGTDILVSGWQYIANGGVASDTTITGWGYQFISAGGSAVSTTMDQGIQYVHGTALSTSISNDGRQSIYDGGSAISTILDGGTQFVSDGGTAVSTNISNGGDQHVLEGGTATSTNISNGGSQYVSAGGTANRTNISNGGQQVVYDSGLATSTNISNGGRQLVLGSAVSTFISNGGIQIVYNSGAAFSTYISGGGEQLISEGGSAINTVISNGGSQYVYSDGAATGTNITSGTQVVFNGGTADGTTVGGGGSIRQDFGATVTNLIMSSGVHILNGATYSGGTYGAGTEQRVGVDSGSSGYASDTVISGGTQTVFSGTADGTVVSAGGSIRQYSNATVTNLNMVSGVHILDGATYSGGTYGAGTLQEVINGGSASDAVITDGGQFVHDGGTAIDTTVNGAGGQSVSTGGSAIRTNISKGYQWVTAGGSAEDTTIGDGGIQGVLAGGSATNTSITSGGEQDVGEGGEVTDTYISDGGAQVIRDGSATSTHISNGGTQNVYTNGSAIDTNISAGGAQHLDNGGSAIRTNIEGGIQYVSNGGTADYTVVDGGGSIHQYSGGTVSNLSMTSGVHILDGVLYSGGTYGTGTEQRIVGGGSASNAFVSGGTQTVSSGVAIGTTVDDGGSLTVYAGGVASNATIADGVLAASAANVLSGAFSLGANGVMDILSTSQTVTGLTGDGVTSIGTGGQLTLNQSASANIYDGSIAGAGGTFVKNGSGILTLTNADNSVGGLVVAGGGVVLGDSGGTAALTGSADVYGGWLGGYGTLAGDVTVHSGGSLAAGSAYDSAAIADYGGMSITGDLNVSSGGVYQVRADYSGSGGPAATDSVTVAGSAAFASGAEVRYVAEGGSVVDLTSQFTVLTAGGGVDGLADAITASSNLRFLKPILEISGGNLLMSFDYGFSGFGDTPNQKAVANALDSLRSGDPDSLAMLLLYNITDADDVNALYDQLSGEMHVSLASGLMLLDRDFSRWILHRSGRKSLARTILSSSAPAFESAQCHTSIHPRALEPRYQNNFWADFAYARQSADDDGNAGRYTLKGPEVSLGYDHIAPSGWIGGVAFRYGDRKMKVDSRLSQADVDSYSVAAYGGFQTAFGSGAARLVAGGAYTRHDIDATRRIRSGLVDQRLTADYHADSHQFFLEGAYAIPLGRLWVEPFADLAWTSIRVPGFVEKGGNARLRSHSQSQSNLSQLLGVRLVLPALGRLNVEAQAGWRHTYGKLDKASAFSFAEGGGRFGIRGAKQNRNEAVLDLRADYAIRDNLRVGLEANAAIGERGHNLRGGAFVALEW